MCIVTTRYYDYCTYDVCILLRTWLTSIIVLISVSISTRKLHFEKLPFYPDGALGQPFGTCFEVHGEHLVPTTRTARRFDFGKCLLVSYTLL